jgi:uncharacterized protein with beta-barrel porin domain
MRFVAALVTLLVASHAMAYAPAAQVVPYINDAATNKFNVLEGVALNATAATRTLTVQVSDVRKTAKDGYRKLIVVVKHTYSAATTLTATPTCSMDGGTTYASETSTSISAGAGTVSVYSDTYTTGAANSVLRLVYDVSGCTNYKVLFGGASGGAGDLINVQAALMVAE